MDPRSDTPARTSVTLRLIAALTAIALMAGVAAAEPADEAGAPVAAGRTAPVDDTGVPAPGAAPGSRAIADVTAVDVDPPGGDVIVEPTAAALSGVTRRGATSDVIEATADLSRSTFADGQAAHAVIGRHDVLADSLAGSSLAGTAGPLLFTTGGPSQSLHPTVPAELRRALPRSGCPKVQCPPGRPSPPLPHVASRALLFSGAESLSCEAGAARFMTLVLVAAPAARST